MIPPHRSSGGIARTQEIRKGEDSDRRAGSLEFAIRACAVASWLGYFYLAYLLVNNGSRIAAVLAALPAVALTAAALLRVLPYRLRAGILTACLFVIASAVLVFSGNQALSLLIYLFSLLLAVGFLSTPVSWGLLAASSLVYALVVALRAFNETTVANTPDLLSSPERSLIPLVVYLVVSLTLAVVMRVWLKHLDHAVETNQILEEALNNERQRHQETLHQITQHYQRQTDLMEAASQVAREISQETNQEHLFQAAIDLIIERFGYYHAGIFLMDDKDEFAVLVCASGEAGKIMRETGHKLRKGEEGIVGHVVATGEARIAHDVGQDAVHFKNPLLPETRSEMALPIKISGRVLGALDVQSNQPQAYSDVDIKALQNIANQLAVAMERVRLFQLHQDTIQELETVLRANTRQTWMEYLRSTKVPRFYHYDPFSDDLKTGQESDPNSAFVEERSEDPAVHQIPITVRGQTIAVLKLRTSGKTIPQDILNLVENTASRMGMALDSARLVDELRYRAERQKLVAELSARVRAGTDVDQILQTSAAALGKALNLKETIIQLYMPEDGQEISTPQEAA